MHKRNGIFIDYKSSLQRVHERIDKNTEEVAKISITLFGDPSKNIEGFLQTNARFTERLGMWMRIFTFVGSTIVIALIGLCIKLFIGGN